MKKVDWKEVLELIGIAAIIGSLIFVGLELQQARQIALSDGDTAVSASFLAFTEQIEDHAEIWQKGAMQLGELNDVEALVFEMLVQSASTVFFYEYRRVARIEGEAGAGVTRRTFVAFLYRNPGARAEYLRLNEEIQRVRETLAPGEENLSEFSEAVIRDLDALDRAGF